MEKRTLVIGIDYTDEYCQASYFNLHHMKPESVMTGAAVMRYLIPVAVCADTDNEDWVIGEEAMHMSEQTGRYLFRKLILGAVNGEMYELNGKKRSYDTLAAVYFGKLLELVRLHSGITDSEHITVTLRRVTLDVKKTIENIFGILGIDAARITVLSYTESFAYYVLGEDDSLWKFLASGDFEVDAATKAKAKEDISEDGYWGVKQTSQRLFDFASALAGDDEEKMKEMQKAIEKGFKEATSAWGKDLPEISNQTLEATNKLFEDYYASKKA